MLFWKETNGSILIQVVTFTGIALFLLGGLVNWGRLVIKTAEHESARLQSFLIAESGAEYYRWHLSHDADDYQDGTGTSGPYTHVFKNKDEIALGEFELTITPPPAGSTRVTVLSKGTTTNTPGALRAIRTELSVPSLAKYAVAADDDMRFGEGTEVFGPIHSNGGIRFDGIAHNIVSSEEYSYHDPDHEGNAEYGVHTHVSPQDPFPDTPLPVRQDIFQAGREIGSPAIDFEGITATLSDLKTQAQNGGHYFAASGDQGYHIVLNPDDTFDLYTITSLVPAPSQCVSGQDSRTWSIQNEVLLQNYPFPLNNIIFAEDHVWIDGTISTARLTIAVGRFPEAPGQYKDIIINHNLTYTHYNGQDSLGLIAQGNVSVGMVSDDILRIDAALVAKNQRVGRPYYDPPADGEDACSPYHIRNTITLYGMIATNQRYGFAYTDGTGYQNRNIIYDANLLYSPPPNFPLPSDQYEIISWEEIE